LYKKQKRPELTGVSNYLQNHHDDYDKITYYLKDLFLLPKNDYTHIILIQLTVRKKIDFTRKVGA